MLYPVSFKWLSSFVSISLVLAACSSQTLNQTQAMPTADKELHLRFASPYSETLVYSFTQKVNYPVNPTGPLTLGSGGTIYGTAGAYWKSGSGGRGDGAVYAIPTGGSQPTVQVLHLFDGSDGFQPHSGVIRGPDGSLYSTTYYGGNYPYPACPVGCGVLFKLTNAGSTWTEKILHKFDDPNVSHDGAYPSGPPLLVNGVLYAVTNLGGSNSCSGGCGTIYKINTDGTGYAILHNFSGGATNFPDGSLTADGTGTLYGTTAFGGGGSCDSALGCGAVFKINAAGTAFMILHAFTGVNGDDGAAPTTGVALVNGKLLGTTAGGGLTGCAIQGHDAAGCGVIFELSQGPSAWSETILHEFVPTNGQSRIPSGLFAADNGLLYGTTSYGVGCKNYNFPDGCGTIFDTTITGSFTEVHVFQGPPSDGAFPFGGPPAGPPMMPSSPPQIAVDGPSGSGAGLVFDNSGTIWGGTAEGGSGNCNGFGCGAIYKVGGANARIHRHRH